MIAPVVASAIASAVFAERSVFPVRVSIFWIDIIILTRIPVISPVTMIAGAPAAGAGPGASFVGAKSAADQRAIGCAAARTSSENFTGNRAAGSADSGAGERAFAC